MRKKYRSAPRLCCAALMLCAGLLAGCGDTNEGGDSRKPSPDSPERQLLYYGTERHWEEELDAVTESGGRVKVVIDADTEVTPVRSAFVSEAAEFEMTQEYKESALRQVFGASEIYLYDSAHMPREQLIRQIALLVYEEGTLSEELEQSSDRETKERRQRRLDAVRSQLEEYRDCLDFAPTELIAADSLEGDAFAGYRDGIMYAVYFQEYLNENPKGHRAGVFTMLPPGQISYPVRNQSILIEPVDITEVAPERFRHSVRIETDDFWEDAWEASSENTAAGEIADRFIRNMGLNADRIDYGLNADGEKTGSAGILRWREPGSGSEPVSEGFYFNYSVSLDTDGQVMAYESDVFFNSWGAYADVSDPQYSKKCTMTVYVKGDSVIYAEINNPVEVVSVSGQVDVLPQDIIKDIIRTELAENIQKYTVSEAADGSVIRFDNMLFNYARIRDQERKGMYSYVPVWRLYGSNKASRGLGADNIVIINAIDGTPIDVRDLI